MPLSKKVFITPSFWKLVWHLPKLLRPVLRLMRDRRVPLPGKLAVVAACAYVVSPVDLLPDFVLPPLGLSDDFAILLAALRFLFKLTPPQVLQEHLGELDLHAIS
ncbi:MAG: DUF1232 domain-containing protein [candidate division KSB1 bacterium]|nr:DUF1232 domain-containing protein [candidate division KSB1 bacterium]MDZ7272642.1 DUF1232 domain-containing protein [candidate division KSB1 bacterium]MDZ7284336.1 DUF1232 domain-containing protein [candidate division KSB1 bacterium]MDZ7297268.1 DUF1232 domain-containing protein [candidate division KSB1 bacterium]MDZ7309041.1 DUF1232 domain-containing protein [candidate division KSB1 bacterium]